MWRPVFLRTGDVRPQRHPLRACPLLPKRAICPARLEGAPVIRSTHHAAICVDALQSIVEGARPFSFEQRHNIVPAG